MTAPFTQGSLWRRADTTTLPSCQESTCSPLHRGGYNVVNSFRHGYAVPPPSGREAGRVSLFPCLSPRGQEVFSYGRENFVRYSIERSAVIGSMLTKMRRLPQSCRRCSIGRQAGSLLSWAPEKDFAKQKIFWEKGEKALSCLSGFPQKSRSEFCGKRSGRHIRSCGKRSAPQTKTPCRDEVGL